MEEASDSFTLAPTTTTRLHITPLDPELLQVIIPAKVLSVAANISYHTLDSFPEKRYGFVDLPAEEAERIKKKLNGAVLRGVKISIEKARPSRESLVMARRDAEQQSFETEKKTNTERAPKEKKDRSKKRKRGAEEIVGVELEQGRKVKRGWTVTPKEAREARSNDKCKKKGKKDEDKKKRREQKSLYTDGSECLIRTVLPASGHGTATSAAQDGSVKKRKKDQTCVIHEFKKTKKFPTFLKSSTSSKPVPTEYVEGTGWVDEDGNVVEPVRSTRSMGRKQMEKLPSQNPLAAAAAENTENTPEPGPVESDAENTTSSSGSDTSSDDDCEEQVTSKEMLPPMKLRPGCISIPEAPSPTQSHEKRDGASSAVFKMHSPRPKSASSVVSLTIKIPPATPATPARATVHPLEALYKRPKPDDKEAAVMPEEKPGFTFFGGDDFVDEDTEDQNDEVDSRSLQPPMTPFTRQDWEHRNLRSAAPTPDTAHHNRSFKFWPPPGEEDEFVEAQDEEDGDDQDGSTSQVAATADGDKAATTDFQKWFWENRGDLNRSWKKRRKLAGKEKRYRENRSRASRAV